MAMTDQMPSTGFSPLRRPSRRSSGAATPSTSLLSYSQHTRPPPGRRRSTLAGLSRIRWSLQLLVLVCCFLFVTNASETIENEGDLFRSTRDRLARKGEIVVDRRPLPIPAAAAAPEHGETGELRRRQNTNNPFDNNPKPAPGRPSSSSSPPPPSSPSTAAPPPSTTIPEATIPSSDVPAPSPTSNSGASPSSSSSSDSKPSSTASTLPNSTSSTASASSSSSVAPSSTAKLGDPSAPAASPLPMVFDTSLGSNFTSASCPNFFQTFMQNSTFRACLPVSLLLQVCCLRIFSPDCQSWSATNARSQNSNSFFQAEKSIVSITQTLDAACAANAKTCQAVMADFGSRIKKNENCGPDFQRQNPIVLQAYNGFIAYAAMYQATCLRSSTGSYCFADAITNVASPTDSYIYYVALGLGLPGGSRLTCNKCLQDTLKVYSDASSNTTQPVSQRYVETAQVINLSCGPNYVNATIPAVKSAASRMGSSTGVISSTSLMALAASLMASLLVL